MALQHRSSEPQPEPAVALALQRMGLASDDLRGAARAGEDDASRVTENDVVTRAGFLRWSTPLRYLGDIYVPKGWKRERPGNFEVLTSPDRSFRIAVAPGNAATGTERMPTTRIDRGPLTGQAVLGNRDQTRFDSNIVPLSRHEVLASTMRAPATWLLLTYPDEFAGELRVELSLPVEFTRKSGVDAERGAVTRFAPRLVLPSIPFVDEASIHDEDQGDDEIDIRIRRR